MTARGFSDSLPAVHQLDRAPSEPLLELLSIEAQPLRLAADDTRYGVRTCPPCQGECTHGRDCPARARYYGVPSREDHYEALDRSARAAWRVIAAIGLVALAVLVAEALFPGLREWLS